MIQGNDFEVAGTLEVFRNHTCYCIHPYSSPQNVLRAQKRRQARTWISNSSDLELSCLGDQAPVICNLSLLGIILLWLFVTKSQSNLREVLKTPYFSLTWTSEYSIILPCGKHTVLSRTSAPLDGI